MNTFNIELPLTNEDFVNKAPDIWVGDELAVLMDAEMEEHFDGEIYTYTWKAKYATNKDVSKCKVFAVEPMFRPDKPVNVSEYVW